MIRKVCLSALLSAGLASCGQSAANADKNLECAALISASTYLHASGKIQLDQKVYNDTLVSGMTYLNMYAIPNGVAEKDAFNALNTRRDEIIAAQKPQRVKSRAKTCMRRAPKV